MTIHNGLSAEEERIVNVAEEHLKAICNTAVSILAEAKGVDSDLIFSNIKTLLLNGDTPEKRYCVIQRSGRTPEKRNDDDKRKRKDPDYLDRNGVYAQILDEHDSRDYCLIPDSTEPGIPNIRAYIEHMHVRHGDRYSEPTVTSSLDYSYCLVVPLRGPWSALIERKRFFEGGPGSAEQWTWCELREDAVLGFMCIDSKVVKFDAQLDLIVANHMAREAFNTIRGYYSALAKLQQTSDRGISHA